MIEILYEDNHLIAVNKKPGDIVQGDRISRDDIIRRLVEMQYTRNELEFLRGTYRIRGEIIDIFPAESDQHAVRVELFDHEVDSIRWFDKTSEFGAFWN